MNNVITCFMSSIEGMRFYTVDELYTKKEHIKPKFEELSPDMKEMYKWYFFFQLCLLKNPLKSALWDFICGCDNEKIVDLEYTKFCEKREQIKERQI